MSGLLHVMASVSPATERQSKSLSIRSARSWAVAQLGWPAAVRASDSLSTVVWPLQLRTCSRPRLRSAVQDSNGGTDGLGACPRGLLARSRWSTGDAAGNSIRNGGFDALGGEREFPDAYARRTGEGVGDGCRRRSLGRFSRTEEGLTRLVDEVHFDRIGQIGEAQNRIGAPIPALDAGLIK